MDDDIDKLDESFEEKDRGNFDKLFEDAQRKAYPGCENSVLSFRCQDTSVKVNKKLSNSTFDMVMTVIKGMLPKKLWSRQQAFVMLRLRFIAQKVKKKKKNIVKKFLFYYLILF